MEQKSTQSKHSSTFERAADNLLSELDLAESLHKIQFYQHLSSAEDLSGFLDQIREVVSKMGFSDFSIGHIVALSTGNSKHFIDTREAWLNIYLQRGYYRQDMLLQHCAVSCKPVYASSLEHYLTSAPFHTEQIECNRELIKLNKSHGYNDCYHIPFKIYKGVGNAVFSVMAKNVSQEAFRRLTLEAKPVLYLLAEAIDYIGSTKFPELFTAKPSRREMFGKSKPLQLLTTLASKNLTLKEASKVHFISLDTANKHVALAKSLLGVRTLPTAVYTAIKQGLISVDD